MLISASLSIMLAKSVQAAEPFLEPWISKSNEIAIINHLQEERRRQMAAAAEKRVQQEESRGMKDPEGIIC